ncbi:hypothetical protein [Cohaesibacter intestini]|uniref:hypothetical protein n=1 Tax=Cohaesibacter intestini TaxID=2211145 RepID=UPI000DE80E17|nr:hypothetical protein [Cohaesibacter intestini]
MRIVYVHIGMHKTGTTAIQACMKGFDDGKTRYADELGHENHSLPLYAGYSDREQTYSQFLSLGMNKEDIARQKDQSLARIKQALASNKTDNLIFSGEDIALIQRDGLLAFKQALATVFDRIMIVAFVRSPVDYLDSQLRQVIKSGFNSPTIARPNYRNRFEKFIDLFGRENVAFIPYDKNTDAYDSFCKVIGIEKRDLRVQKNQKLGLEATKLVYLLNKISSRFDKDSSIRAARNQFIDAVSHILQDREAIPAPLIEPLVDHDDLAWLLANTDIDFPMPPYSHSAHFRMDSLDQFLSNPRQESVQKLADLLPRNEPVEPYLCDPMIAVTRSFIHLLQNRMRMIEQFDPTLYLDANPDLKAAGVNPYHHLLAHGLKEGRKLQ